MFSQRPLGLAQSLDMVRSMMSSSKLLISFWGYTFETSTRVLDVLPRKSLACIPYEILKGNKVNDNSKIYVTFMHH